MADMKNLTLAGTTYNFRDAQAREDIAAIQAVTDSVADMSRTVTTTGSTADLDMIDADGNVLARFSGGNFQTKNFNSADVAKLFWVGKKWAAVGDSLTEVNIRTTLHYHDYIAQQTGITVVNLGHSGAGYYARPSDYTFRNQVGNVPLDTDVVTIFGSGNDIGKEDLGDITDATASTLCGCINITLDNMYTRLPAVNLGIVTPTPWYATGSSTDWTPNNPGNPMELYCEAIVAICKRRSIPCLDLYHCSNLRPQNATARALEYSNDDGNGVHPDETGHLLIAPRFLSFLHSLLM